LQSQTAHIYRTLVAISLLNLSKGFAMMSIDKAINTLEPLLPLSMVDGCREAWQTLKAAVLAQQTTNKQSDEITPSCIECSSFYACTHKPDKVGGCFPMSA
jgi:hypothetical protein